MMIDKKMKVLVLHPPMYPVNYEFYNLLGRKADVTVWQFGEYPSDHPHWDYSSLKKLNTTINFKIIGKGSDSLKNQLYVFRYTIEIKKLNPDIVLSIAFWIPSLYSSLLKHILKFKLIILTNAIFETEKNASSFRKIIRKIISINTDAFISASNLTSKFIKTINNNANVFLSVQTTDVSQWRKEFNKTRGIHTLKEELLINDSTVLMLGVGNYINKKNWITVFDALKRIDNIVFLLVGDGEDREKYENIIEINNLKEKVILVGRKSNLELKEYFKVSDFLIFPSLYDQFGFVVAEALSSGLPVICTKKAGSEVLIKEGYNGYKYEKDENLLETINLMIINFKRLKENAYESIKDKTLENRVNEFYYIFKKVLSK